MFLIILLHFSYLGFGLAVISRFFKLDEYSWSFLIPISYFVGIFAHVVVIHISITLKFTSPLISWSLFVIGIAAFIFKIWFLIKTKALTFQFVAKLPKTWILNSAIIILLIPVVYLISLKLVCLPDITYDSTAFWNLKAKYFFYGEHLWTDAFMDNRRVHAHKGYPLYMPIVIFEHFSILGDTDDWLTKYGTWIFYTFGMILYFLLIRQWTSTTISLLTTIFMLYSPLYSYRSIPGSITNTYMDFPLSIMIAASAGLFIRYQFYNKPLDIFGACIFVASCILLKREGSIWFILFFLFVAFTIIFNRKKFWQNEFAWLILPVIVFILWKLLSTKLPPESEIELPTLEQLSNLSSALTKIIRSWMISIFKFRLWGFIPIFVIFYFMIGLLKNVCNVTLVLTASMVIGYLVAIFIILILIDIQTSDFDWYMSVTYDRLIIQVLPVSLLLTILMNSNKCTNRLTDI